MNENVEMKINDKEYWKFFFNKECENELKE